jgi:hypothetical protein
MAGAHLLIYEFRPGADFEGQLVGALERIEATGEAHVLDGLFAANDVETGELAAIDLRAASRASAVAGLLTFRLDARARRKATARALGNSGSVPAEVVRSIGRALKPGGALLALLVERPPWRELGEAVQRTGGSLVSAEAVQSSGLAELAPRLLAATQDRSAG